MDTNETVSKLKSFRFVHSIILFGSKARGTEKEKSNMDICIIPEPDVEITLKERISLVNSMPENVDISFIDEYRRHVMERVRTKLR
ncbi:MAG TPA: nucleotidyltransferase domain-containing protein [Candidatus Methanoperedens sp.]